MAETSCIINNKARVRTRHWPCSILLHLFPTDLQMILFWLSLFYHTYPFAPTFNCIPTALAISILYRFVSSQHPCESLISPPKCCLYGRHCGVLCDRKYECGGMSCYVVTSEHVSINRLILSSRSNAGYGRCNNVWSVPNVLQTRNIFELISVHEAWVWISKHFSLCRMK
jgi:hypothetical protein